MIDILGGMLQITFPVFVVSEVPSGLTGNKAKCGQNKRNTSSYLCGSYDAFWKFRDCYVWTLTFTLHWPPPIFIVYSPGSAFDLKVQVDDALTRQQLSQASVEVYVNYTRISTALTGEDGSVLLHVPHQTGMQIAVVASKDGYICTLLPCKTDRTPSKMFI